MVLLDFTLILMAAVWLMVGLYRGLTNLELWYNFVYVILNVAALSLNLKIIKAQK